MATFLDLGVFSYFSVIFTFLLVYVIVFGTLEWGRPFGKLGDEKTARGLHAIIALAVAAMAVMSPSIVRMINFTVPWFLIMALVAFFIIFVVKMFGGEKLDLHKAVTSSSRIYTWIIVFTIVILIFGFGHAFGSETLEKGQWETSPPGNEEAGGVTSQPSSGVDEFIETTGVGNADVSGSRVATSDFGTNVLNTLVHPKVLGLILIMVIGVFAIFFLAD